MINHKIKSTDYIEFKKKRQARLLVTRAIHKGCLIRSDSCQKCNETGRTSAHHIDYGKPLSVLWLCSKCHGEAHRSDNELNPKNNEQTPVPYIWNESDSVTISINIPIKQFMVLKKECEEKNKNISTIMRESIVKNYPIESSQLEFNFEEVKHDHSHDDKNKDISSMDKDKTKLLQSEIPSVSFIRVTTSDSLRKVEEQLYPVSYGYGRDADKIQLNKIKE